MAEKKSEIVHESGKRKTAYARTTIKPGKGNIRINSTSLAVYGDKFLRMRIEEPLMIAKGLVDISKLDFTITARGGGFSGQADAISTSIARALVSYAEKSRKGEELKAKLVEYDRSLISGDSRRTEPHKPSKSSQGPRGKRQKSYR
jgi:small subunit ribosomal protein S9